MTATTTEQARTLVSRAVLWTGIALGTCLAILAITDGVRLRIGGMPSVLGVILGAVLVWALIVLAAVALAELVRRHHRAAGRYALKQGKRGAVATARHAPARGTARVAGVQGRSRWESREHRPLMFLRLRGEPEDPAAETAPEAEAAAPGAAPDAPPPDDPDGGTTSMTVSKIAPQRRARRAAARTGGSVPSEWGPVIAQTADFEPEDDGELLDWMSRQVTGLSAWAEALVDFYEHCTAVIGIDPKASAMLHDVADAAAQAAETMGAAKAQVHRALRAPPGVRGQRRPDDPRRPLDHRRRRLSRKDAASARALGFPARRGPYP